VIWFTADTHLGHGNIIEHCGRPFSNAREMDEALVENLNALVGPDDDVYHLGDFSLSNRKVVADVMRRLSGHIHVLGIPWHHDRSWLMKPGRRDLVLMSQAGTVEILPPEHVLQFHKTPQGHYRRVIHLSHYPLASWDRAHYGAWHLHGHSHGAHTGPGKLLDVGVDCHDFKPISMDEVAGIMEAL